MKPTKLLTSLLLTAAAIGSAPAAANTVLPADSAFYSTIGKQWSPSRGLYLPQKGETAKTRHQALMLRLHVRAIKSGLKSPLNDPIKASALATTLTQASAFVDGKITKWDPNDASQYHRPGFTALSGSSSTSRSLTQHVSIDAETAIALAEAYEARDKIGLAPDLANRIRLSIIRTAKHGLFSPRNIRMGQLIWTANMLWAKRLIDGKDREFLRDYKTALSSMRAVMKKVLTRDGGFRRNWLYPGSSVNLVNSPEYSAISIAGLQYLQWARSRGVKLSNAERSYYRSWVKQLVWGSFSNSGALNWDTGMGDERRYLGQYWSWTVLGLMTLRSSSLLTTAELDRVNGLCRAAQQRLLAWQTKDGMLAKTLYGTSSAFLDSDGDPSLGSMRGYWALETCPSAGALTSGVSFDRSLKRYAVTTNSYATSVLAKNVDAAFGPLPSKLLDVNGEAVGGLGSRRTAFDLSVGNWKLTNNSANKLTLNSKAGSGQLTSGRSKLNLKVVGKSNQAVFSYKFDKEFFVLKGAFKKAGGKNVWKIPLPKGSTVQQQTVNGKQQFLITPTVGSRWSVTVNKVVNTKLAAIARDRFDPTIDRKLLINVGTGKSVELRVAVWRS